MATQKLGNNRLADGSVTGTKIGLNSINANNLSTSLNTYINNLTSTSNITTVSVFETTANGTVATYNIGYNPISQEAVMVTIAGIVQPVSSYSVNVSANTITLSENPENGELLRVASFYSNASLSVYVINDGAINFAKFDSNVSSTIINSFNKANSAFFQTNAAFAHANAAFDVANTEPVAAQAYYHANAAFITANTAFINAAGLDGINNTQNNRITYSEAHANAAFLAANNAGAASTDIYARNHANAAFNTANAGGAVTDTYARNHANASFTKANNALANTGGATFDGILNITGTLRALSQGGDEGGEIFLDKSANNTSLAAGITIDVFQNKLRFFETGGSVRGVFIDIANSAAGGVGTDLLAGGVTTDSYSRNTANAAFIHANAAFAAANAGGGGGTTDVYARNHANAAFTQANTGASPSRTTVSATTASLASNATANLTVTMAKGYGLYKIAVSTGSWVTVYGNIARRNADFTRSITTDPAPGSGVIAEAITTGTTANVTNFTPSLIGYNDDVSVTTNAYIKVYNNSGVTNTVTVTVTYLPLEV